MRAEHLSELEKQIRKASPKILLDLEELTWSTLSSSLPGMCETTGVALLNCSAYIPNWIGKRKRLKDRSHIRLEAEGVSIIASPLAEHSSLKPDVRIDFACKFHVSDGLASLPLGPDEQAFAVNSFVGLKSGMLDRDHAI